MSRELLRQSRHVTTNIPKKNPARMRLLLESIADMPVMVHGARKIGVHTTTVKYWLAKSANGDPGFDITWKGEHLPFHEHWAAAIEMGNGHVEEIMHKRATGFLVPQVHHGRVQYRMDESLLDLGFTGHWAYLRDKDGEPIPETVLEQSEDLLMFIAKTRMREKYGQHSAVDVTVRGGVLVVGVKKTAEQLEAAYGGVQKVVDVEFEEVESDE